jgi:hypothetical protein
MADAAVFKANGLANVELVVCDVVDGVDTHHSGKPPQNAFKCPINRLDSLGVQRYWFIEIEVFRWRWVHVGAFHGTKKHNSWKQEKKR